MKREGRYCACSVYCMALFSTHDLNHPEAASHSSVKFQFMKYNLPTALAVVVAEDILYKHPYNYYVKGLISTNTA